MTAVNERVLQDLQEERNGSTRPEEEDAPMGLIWLKWGHQQASCWGLEKALKATARLHKGEEDPVGGPAGDPDGEAPSAVICYASSEEGLALEVESARALAPHSVVLVFALSPNLRLARGALAAGASGLLHAGMRPEQILRAVRLVLQGETVLPRGLLLEWLDEQRPPDLRVLLSARQREILELVAEGFTNAEIAERLYLSESTIKQHLRAAYKALGVRNRHEATAFWQSYRRGYA